MIIQAISFRLVDEKDRGILPRHNFFVDLSPHVFDCHGCFWQLFKRVLEVLEFEYVVEQVGHVSLLVEILVFDFDVISSL